MLFAFLALSFAKMVSLHNFKGKRMTGKYDGLISKKVKPSTRNNLYQNLGSGEKNFKYTLDDQNFVTKSKAAEIFLDESIGQNSVHLFCNTSEEAINVKLDSIEDKISFNVYLHAKITLKMQENFAFNASIICNNTIDFTSQLEYINVSESNYEMYMLGSWVMKDNCHFSLNSMPAAQSIDINLIELFHDIDPEDNRKIKLIGLIVGVLTIIASFGTIAFFVFVEKRRAKREEEDRLSQEKLLN